MKRLLILLTLVVIMTACEEEKYPGYFKIGEELYYTIHLVGDGERTPATGDHLILTLRYRDKHDNILYSTDSTETGTVDIKIGSSDKPVSLEVGLFKLREGDSATFIMNASEFFTEYLHQELPDRIRKNDEIYIDLRLIQLVPANEYDGYLLSISNSFTDAELDELMRLAEFLGTIDTTGMQLIDGMYYQELVAGSGSRPSSGKFVSIHYTGTFVDGTVFDATPEGEPGEFKIGKKDHLLPGMDAGLRQMRPGTRAKFVIPSYLAYGSAGSSSGIVPPYTTLIYEVELVEVLNP